MAWSQYHPRKRLDPLNCGLRIGVYRQSAVLNPHPAIESAHPLTRGGTDLIGTAICGTASASSALLRVGAYAQGLAWAGFWAIATASCQVRRAVLASQSNLVFSAFLTITRNDHRPECRGDSPTFVYWFALASSRAASASFLPARSPRISIT